MKGHQIQVDLSSEASLSNSDRLSLGPMHPATRVGRVRRQIQSLAALHQSEIESTIQQLNDAQVSDVAARLATYQELHTQETAMVIGELADLEADLAATEARPEPAPVRTPPDPVDPAADSPKRAHWLAEQANRLVIQPISRRGFLFPGSKS